MRLALLFMLVWPSVGRALDLSQQDKQLHVAASYGLTVGAVASGASRWQAAALVLGVGLAKELTDKQVDAQDLQANGLGVGTALLFSYSGSF